MQLLVQVLVLMSTLASLSLIESIKTKKTLSNHLIYKSKNSGACSGAYSMQGVRGGGEASPYAFGPVPFQEVVARVKHIITYDFVTV